MKAIKICIIILCYGIMFYSYAVNASNEAKGILQILAGSMGMHYGYNMMAQSYQKFKPEAKTIWQAFVAEAEVQYYADKCERQATPRNLIPLTAATIKLQYYEKFRLPEAIKKSQQFLITTGMGAAVFVSGVYVLGCGIRNLKTQ